MRIFRFGKDCRIHHVSGPILGRLKAKIKEIASPPFTLCRAYVRIHKLNQTKILQVFCNFSGVRPVICGRLTLKSLVKKKKKKTLQRLERERERKKERKKIPKPMVNLFVKMTRHGLGQKLLKLITKCINMGKPSSPSFRSGAPPISVYYYNTYQKHLPIYYAHLCHLCRGLLV